jgi:hypothetical protein
MNKLFLIPLAVTVIGGLIVAFASGLFSSSSGDNTTNFFNGGKSGAEFGKKTDVPFVIEDWPRKGVWELKSPLSEGWTNRDDPPLNGVRWLQEGTVVKVKCALPGPK